MKTYDITELYGEPWTTAIISVIDAFNSTMGALYFYSRDMWAVEELAHKLGIRFNGNGEIIR